MTWGFTMLFVHLAALCGLCLLYRQAPCWMQRIVVVLLILACTGFVAAQIATLNDMVWEAHLLRRLAFEFEHIGVLLWVFRLIYQDRVQWTSSTRSPSSSR